MSWKKRFLLALSLTKMLFIAIFEDIWFFLSSKIRLLFVSLFKTHSSRIGFYCVILIFLMVFIVTDMLLNLKNDVHRTIILCVALLAWFIFIVVAVSGRHQKRMIDILKAELANEQDKAELIKKVSLLSDTAKIPKPDIYLTNEPYITALSLGKFKGSNIIVLNSKICKLLNEDELNCVIAHEICHLKHFDSLLNTVLLFGFYVVYFFLWIIPMYPINNLRELLTGKKSSYKRYERILYFWGFFLVAPIIIFVLIIGIPIRNIFHEQELRADIWSSYTTGNPLALKTAILKLAAFVQMPKGCSFRLGGLFNIVEPVSRTWVEQKMFQFLHPKNTSRIDTLSLLHKMGTISKSK